MTGLRRVAACVLAVAVVPAAWAAGHKGLSEAQQRYNEERAVCMSGQSNQDRATCLREAGAALQEARRGGLATSTSSLGQNATARCNAQPAADREACVQRIQRPSAVRGSVRDGGLIRETETKVQ